MKNSVEQAIDALNQGGIIIFPTDTAFGIGCKVSNESAVKRLFVVRKRPVEKAMPILVNSVEMAERYVEPIKQDVVEKLIKPFWPGALTIVLPVRKNSLSKFICGSGDTIGVRMPKNSIVLEIIKGVGEGITGPSANFSGRQTPYTFKDIDKNLLKQVDFVVKGETILKQTSTVIDCTIKPWTILRQGAIRPDL